MVPVRDGPDGIEVLMLRRNSKLAFGGMWVFPGGRVDDADADPARPDDELAAARRAAVREAMEEAGIAVDPGDLVPFSHWTPPEAAPKRFSTWFFLAPAWDVGEIVIDGSEIHDHAWLRPSVAVEQRDAGDIELAPPTWVTLWQLSLMSGTEDALRRARERQPRRYATHVVFTDRGMVTLWDGDAGYVDGDADRPGPRHRLWMLPDGWRYESTLD